MKPKMFAAALSPLFLTGAFLTFPTLFTRAQDPAPQAAQAKPAVSGFLEPYPEFKKGEKDFDLVWFREGADFSTYDKIMVDPVVFFFKDDAKYKGIHADELKKLSDAFNKAFTEALGDSSKLVDKPGPGVLRIRAALTEINPNKPAVGAAMAIVPGGSVAYAVLPEKYNNIGSATIEVEFLDSQTNERLAAGIDHKAGKKRDLLSGMETWGHVEKIFKLWSKEFRTWFDAQHGKGVKKDAEAPKGS
jgi:hypothetical protein